MKIIEFCGNPGVGKSTLVTALTKEMRHRGIRTICYIPGTKAGLDYCLLVSKLVYKYYETRFSRNNCFKVPYKEYNDSLSKYLDVDSVRWAVLCLLFFIEQLTDKHIEYLFIDEGFIHRTTLSMYDRNINKEELDYFTSFFNSNIYGKYDAYIAFCSVNQDLNVERIQNREKPCLYKSVEENEMRKKLYIRDSNIKSLINNVKHKGVINIQTDSYNISDVCDKILLATYS